MSRNFPSGPVDKTPSSQCRGLGFDPWLGNQDPTYHNQACVPHLEKPMPLQRSSMAKRNNKLKKKKTKQKTMGRVCHRRETGLVFGSPWPSEASSIFRVLLPLVLGSYNPASTHLLMSFQKLPIPLLLLTMGFHG